MALTDAQLVTYKSHIDANTDPTVVQAVADGANNVITTYYDDESDPEYWIFRREVPMEEVRDAIDAMDIVTMQTADRDRMLALLEVRAERGFSGESGNDILAWDDVFSSPLVDTSQQAIAALWTRVARNIETVFAQGTGTGADADNADVTTYQGGVTIEDTRKAMEL